jgi:hypothetical protein
MFGSSLLCAFVNGNALAFLLQVRKVRQRGKGQEITPVLEQSRQNITARVRATIEEELGAFRRFADLPATEIEDMAARLVRAIAPHLAGAEPEASPSV